MAAKVNFSKANSQKDDICLEKTETNWLSTIGLAMVYVI